MGAVLTAREMGVVSFVAHFLEWARREAAEAGNTVFDKRIGNHAAWLSWATEDEKTMERESRRPQPPCFREGR